LPPSRGRCAPLRFRMSALQGALIVSVCWPNALARSAQSSVIFCSAFCPCFFVDPEQSGHITIIAFLRDGAVLEAGNRRAYPAGHLRCQTFFLLLRWLSGVAFPLKCQATWLIIQEESKRIPIREGPNLDRNPLASFLHFWQVGEMMGIRTTALSASWLICMGGPWNGKGKRLSQSLSKKRWVRGLNPGGGRVSLSGGQGPRRGLGAC